MECDARPQNENLELANGREVVVVRVLAVDEADDGAVVTRLSILADAGVFQ